MNGTKQSVGAHPETGELVTLYTKVDKATGEEVTYGRVRIDETKRVNNNGFMSLAKRSAFVTLNAEILEEIAPLLVEGQPYPDEGKIIVIETFEPQYDKHTPKINPTTKQYVKVNDKPVYMQQIFTFDMNAQDQLIRNNGY